MRQLPSFFSLRAFESAARFESFTSAGQELHLAAVATALVGESGASEGVVPALGA